MMSIVTTGPDTGYYADVFRSRKERGGDKMHDYFYHNLGQSMTLTAVDGTDMTYLDAEGQGQNKTFTSNGKQQTVHKVVNKKPVTAVKLTPKNGEAPMYFVIVNDTTLRLVNDSLQEAVSDLNYDIIKVKQ